MATQLKLEVFGEKSRDHPDIYREKKNNNNSNVFFPLSFKRVLMGLTDSRKTAKNLVDSSKNWKTLTVSRK